MLTTKLLPWIEQLAPPAKNKLAQIIFDNAERIQDLQSMKHCRIVIDALTVEDAALRRFFDSLTQSRNILIEGLIELAESFAGRPQARSYLARAILQDARRLNACGASLDTVVAMLAPKDIVEIVDIQIASRTMLTAELALKFIQTGHLTSEQVKRLAPICLFTRNTAAAFFSAKSIKFERIIRTIKSSSGSRNAGGSKRTYNFITTDPIRQRRHSNA